MIISPPFLPTLNLPADPTAVDPMMDALDKLEIGHHGTYPVAFDRRWHCGIHLAPTKQTEPVRAIADGEVVAYRVSKRAISDGQTMLGTGLPALNSNTGFVLLKHHTETGEGRSITFYSLYMHLLDMTAQEQIAPQPSKPPAMGSVNQLPAWLLDNTHDGQVLPGNGKKVNRKDMLGYWGQCHGYPHLHFEIFMTEEDFAGWFESPGLAVKDRPTPTSTDYWGHSYYVISGAQAFVSLPPGHTGPNDPFFTPLHAGTLPAGSKLYVEAYFHKGQRYMLSWLEQDGKTTPLTNDKPVLDPNKDFEYKMFARASALYPTCPSDGYELLRFGRVLSHATTPALTLPAWVAVPFENGKQGYIDISQNKITKLSDADFPSFMDWQKITEATSPFDRDGLCDHTALRQLLKDVEAEHPPAAGKPVAKLTGQGASIKELQELEAQLASYVQSHDSVRKKLRGFICHAPSEWDAMGNDERYRLLNDPNGFFGSRKATNPTGYDDFIKFKQQLQFLEKTPLGGGKKFWFFHPSAFIRHFRKCGWLSKDELSQIYAESTYKSVEKKGEDYKEHYRPPINEVLRKYLFNTPIRGAHFFGQCSIESFYMMVVRECGVAISLAIKKNHIHIAPETKGYLHSPPASTADVSYFSKLYDGRISLGNTDAGDGVKFRGR